MTLPQTNRALQSKPWALQSTGFDRKVCNVIFSEHNMDQELLAYNPNRPTIRDTDALKHYLSTGPSFNAPIKVRGFIIVSICIIFSFST